MEGGNLGSDALLHRSILRRACPNDLQWMPGVRSEVHLAKFDQILQLQLSRFSVKRALTNGNIPFTHFLATGSLSTFNGCPFTTKSTRKQPSCW
ncbi:uncharacterized protein CIMG_01920 [Coccidioides immitis RS]|uniref:Uncharacterized protein n=1 Tax=Coccidioides immitis (strain RS) TaxID=246410 RepID=A0A0E1S0L5_COCIM|nr:uncharacterized protein CIMG_01920 [Coccidioides immitis RS]EAS36566.2 hypothetical protein CIMG_01920 [Coccidioides immitis RS]